MLLEEVLLHLLRVSGYQPVGAVQSDPTLGLGPSGLIVKGRGTDHQIDAVADFAVQQPFAYVQRLLVEAKCYDAGKRVELPVLRNAVGVLKDVSEFWIRQGGVPGRRTPPTPRYHYQCAVFSATGFTGPAQDFAFTQDIFPISLENSRSFNRVIEAVRATADSLDQTGVGTKLSGLRKRVREDLSSLSGGGGIASDHAPFEQIVDVCRGMSGGLLASLGGQFPVFLSPATGIRVEELQTRLEVRITWDDNGWYVNERSPDSRRLFSLDIPRQLFLHYANSGRLSSKAAVNLKEQVMADFQAVRAIDGRIDVIQFSMDREWLEELRSQVESRGSA